MLWFTRKKEVRQDPPAPRYVPDEWDLYKAGRITWEQLEEAHAATWGETNAEMYLAIAVDSFKDRGSQVKYWIQGMTQAMGRPPMQKEVAAAFGLTPGRISQLLH